MPKGRGVPRSRGRERKDDDDDDDDDDDEGILNEETGPFPLLG